jgi:hypothetical protein
MDDFATQRIEIVYGQVFLELVGSVMLGVVSYYVYKGIEIGHPVYAILLCDLIATLVSTL